MNLQRQYSNWIDDSDINHPFQRTTENRVLHLIAIKSNFTIHIFVVSLFLFFLFVR